MSDSISLKAKGKQPKRYSILVIRVTQLRQSLSSRGHGFACLSNMLKIRKTVKCTKLTTKS